MYLGDCSLFFSDVSGVNEVRKGDMAGILKKKLSGDLEGLSVKNLGFWIYSLKLNIESF